MSTDLYGVLGIARGASDDEIRKRYRKLARELHPDLNPDDAAAEQRFKEVGAAYSVLSDERKRKLYDEFGEVALQAGFDEQRAEQMRRFGGGGGFNYGDWSNSEFSDFESHGGLQDLLRSLLGGGMGGMGGMGGRPRPAKGRDLETTLTIDLPTSIRGGGQEISVAGRGRIEVKIPPGIESGKKLRLGGLGSPGARGGPPGDLFVKVLVTPHSCYRREGEHLHVDIPVTLHEALNGAKVSFQTPKGEVTVGVPAGAQSGQTLRLKGVGATSSGNLYAHVVLVAPPSSPETLELAQQLEAHYPEGGVRQTILF